LLGQAAMRPSEEKRPILKEKKANNVEINLIRVAVLLVLLAALVSLLFVKPFVQYLRKPTSYSVCLVNLANDPYLGSLFSRGTLERYGSINRFKVVSPTEGCHDASVRLDLVNDRQLMEWCLGTEMCVVAGDSLCKSPGTSLNNLHNFLLHTPFLYAVHPEKAGTGLIRQQELLSIHNVSRSQEIISTQEINPTQEASELSQAELQVKHDSGILRLRPNVILRHFSSSKYNYPAIPLGARSDFKQVSEAEFEANHRKYLVNFMGLVVQGFLPDRAHMRNVIQDHKWAVPTKFKFFDNTVRMPNETTLREYRDTLLQSSFTLAPVGNGDDTYRFWEAIEAGSIPIFVRRMIQPHRAVHCPDAFQEILETKPPIVLLDSWDDLPPFAETVTEKQIYEMQIKLKVWAQIFWTTTARNIDKAIHQALLIREAALAAALPESLKEHTEEVSVAVSMLRDKQTIMHAEEEALKIRVKQEKIEAEKLRQQEKIEAKERRKEEKQKKLELKAAYKAEKQDRLTEKQKEKIEAQRRQQMNLNKLLFASKIDGSAERLVQMIKEIIPGMMVDENSLKNLPFRYEHGLIVNILAATSYQNSLFSSKELDSKTGYMKYHINQATFLDKIIAAVAVDMDIPDDFITSAEMMKRSEAMKTRKFLCFLVKAAQITSEN
jgi:hypothetical protein